MYLFFKNMNMVNKLQDRIRNKKVAIYRIFTCFTTSTLKGKYKDFLFPETFGREKTERVEIFHVR